MGNLPKPPSVLRLCLLTVAAPFRAGRQVLFRGDAHWPIPPGPQAVAGPASLYACIACSQHDVAAATTWSYVVPGSGLHEASQEVQDVAAHEHQAPALAGSEATNASEQSITANTKRRFLSM